MRKHLISFILVLLLIFVNSVTVNADSNKTSNSGETIVSYAMTWNDNKNIHYKNGGPVGRGKSLEEGDKNKLTTDCSGFVAAVYSHFNISLPAQSESIHNAAKSTTTDIKKAEPGDVCWWNGHVGIYIGDGKMIHISNSDPKSAGYYIHVVKLESYGRYMNGTTTFCRMTDDRSLLGKGTSSKAVEEAKTSGCALTESDLTGMPIPSTLEASQELIRLYGADDLSLVDNNSIDVIKQNMNSRKVNIERYIGIICSLLGLLMIIYSVVILFAVVIDYVNKWIDISLVSLLSFNRWHLVSSYDIKEGLVKVGYNKNKKKTYLTIKLLVFRISIVFLTGLLLLKHIPLNVVANIIYKINNKGL